jgi:anti-anti-sigma factor
MTVGVQAESLELLIAGLRIVVAEETTASTIALEGEWDLAQQNKALLGFDHVLARHPQRVVLDLSRLTFMDSAGLHGVTELARRAAHLEIELAVVPGPRAVQRLFELSPLTESIMSIDRG